MHLLNICIDHLKYKPGRGRPGASLKAMNSMLSRDGRRDVIKMAVVIGGSGGTRRASNAGHHGSVSHAAAGKPL